MIGIRGMLPVLIGIWLSLMAAAADAADLLGLYVGGAIGESHVRFDGLDFQENYSAWKLLAGIRPLAWVGAEFDYMDFGRSSASGQITLPVVTSPTPFAKATADAQATALYGLLYLPLPLPLLDIYGKAGVARLQSSVGATRTLPELFCQDPTCRFQRSVIDVHLAYGVGVQVKVTHFAVRAEYERISVSSGDPDLLSLGLSWSF